MGCCASVNDGGVAVSWSVNEEPRVTGVHQFTIRQYSRIKGKGVGKSVLSQDFTVAGRSWFIRFYPDGYNNTTTDHVAFFLQSLYRPRFGSVYHVEFSFALLNPNVAGEGGAAVVHDVRCEQPCRFDNHHNSWGIRKYITREQLEGAALGAIHDDSLTVRCTVHVIQHRRSRGAGPVYSPVRVQVPPSCHAKNAMDFLLSGDAPFDLEIHVGDTTFKAHRLVLAGQSLYFRKLLYGRGNEANSPHIAIHERSPEAFGAVLHYIYHDKLPKEVTKGRDATAAVARELFEAADMYAMERLKLICASVLCRYIDDDTAGTIMELGKVHSCEALTRACQNYMNRRRISARRWQNQSTQQIIGSSLGCIL